MKNKISFFGKLLDCEHKELFALQGEERYEVIRILPVVAPELICKFYKDCRRCPLYIKNSFGRNLCSDIASDREVYEAFSYGAKFVTLEESKNEKDN